MEKSWVYSAEDKWKFYSESDMQVPKMFNKMPGSIREKREFPRIKLENMNSDQIA